MNENKNNICGIVQDLLPLYIDRICSRQSSVLIERHLTECSECSRVKELLSDKSIEASIEDERKGVLARHAAKERSAAWKAGAIIAGLLLIPIAIAVILTARGSSSAGTLLVLTASLGLVAAMTVLPLMTRKNRFAKAIIFSTIAIILIELFVCTFFSKVSFVKTAVPTVLGISVPFFPFVVKGARLPEPLKNKKTLIVLAWDTLWLYLTVIVSLFDQSPAYLYSGICTATVFVLLPWIIYAAAKIKAVSLSKCAHIGRIAIGIGIWMLIAEYQAFFVISGGVFHWTKNASLNQRLCIIIPVLILAAGIVLILTDRAKRLRKTK